MKHLTLFLGVAMTVVVGGRGVLAQTGQSGGSLQQEGFVPIDQLPAQEQLPAAPLLIAAYAFVLVVLFLYIVSVARRLTSVQQQMTRLEGDIVRNKKG